MRCIYTPAWIPLSKIVPLFLNKGRAITAGCTDFIFDNLQN